MSQGVAKPVSARLTQRTLSFAVRNEGRSIELMLKLVWISALCLGAWAAHSLLSPQALYFLAGIIWMAVASWALHDASEAKEEARKLRRELDSIKAALGARTDP